MSGERNEFTSVIRRIIVGKRIKRTWLNPLMVGLLEQTFNVAYYRQRNYGEQNWKMTQDLKGQRYRTRGEEGVSNRCAEMVSELFQLTMPHFCHDLTHRKLRALYYKHPKLRGKAPAKLVTNQAS